MSGGSLNYFYGDLECHTEDFNDKELNELVKDLATLFHDREWFLSGDTCEGAWNEARDAFKKKWFGHDSQKLRMERINRYLDEIREDLMKQFGVSERYCRNCNHWTQDERENYEEYGSCELVKSCLMHRSENCGEWRPKEEKTDDRDA